MMRFQNPIMDSSNGPSPRQAPLLLSSLIATTYIEWHTSSITNRHDRNRIAYDVTVLVEIGSGAIVWDTKLLKVIMGPARYSGGYSA